MCNVLTVGIDRSRLFIIQVHLSIICSIVVPGVTLLRVVLLSSKETFYTRDVQHDDMRITIQARKLVHVIPICIDETVLYNKCLIFK